MQEFIKARLFCDIAEYDRGTVHESACCDRPGMGVLNRGMGCAGGHAHARRRLFCLLIGRLLT